ncbi:hypothetical protein [Jiangella alba]|uniref:hypothetical protein n=1 Tax=Jiangella alba TaxID=561176 RepID=UPI000943EDFA|nr:hypothetical protein [Jiangella alba]
MSAATAGLVTAIPVLCFALLAPAVTLAGQRAGIDAVALAGCLLIRAGSLLRVLDGTTVLLAGTVLVGAGITTGNILAPVVVRRDDAGRTAAVARGLAGVDRDRRTRAGRRHRAGDGADRARRRLPGDRRLDRPAARAGGRLGGHGRGGLDGRPGASAG